MECLTPAFGFDIFMNSNYRSFRLLTHIGVNNIWPTELDYANALSLGEIAAKKRKVATLNSAHQIKNSVFLSGWLEQQQVN